MFYGNDNFDVSHNSYAFLSIFLLSLEINNNLYICHIVDIKNCNGNQKIRSQKYNYMEGKSINIILYSVLLKITKTLKILI